MKKNEKVWSRRTMLRGAGVAIALPTLEAFLSPSRHFRNAVEAQSPETPKRLVIFHIPEGYVMRDFTPDRLGTGWSATPMLAPFAGRERDISVLTGLRYYQLVEPWYFDFDVNHHPLMASTFLTCVPPRIGPLTMPDSGLGETLQVETPGGPSADRVAGEAFADVTPFASLYFNAMPHRTLTNRVSWTGADSPTTPLDNVQQTFDYLFSDLGPSDAANRARALRTSVLDAVKDSIASFQGRVGASDRIRLDEHLSAIRDLERRVTAVCEAPPDPGPPDAYEGNENYVARQDVLIDMAAMALKCDLTRVVLFSMTDTGSYYHGPAHWNDDNPTGLAEYTAGCVEKVSRFAHFLDVLESTLDGTGTLLDSSAVVGVSEYSDAGHHWPEHVPVLVAGRLGGQVGAQHLVVPNPSPHDRIRAPGLEAFADGGHTPLANLWLTMMRAVGIEATAFGDSTGVISGLWGV